MACVQINLAETVVIITLFALIFYNLYVSYLFCFFFLLKSESNLFQTQKIQYVIKINVSNVNFKKSKCWKNFTKNKLSIDKIKYYALDCVIYFIS